MSERLHGPEEDPKTPSQAIAAMLGETYDKEAGFDEETLQEIADLSFEEAFETAYSYLTQAGLEADAVLYPWIEPGPGEIQD